MNRNSCPYRAKAYGTCARALALYRGGGGGGVPEGGGGGWLPEGGGGGGEPPELPMGGPELPVGCPVGGGGGTVP